MSLIQGSAIANLDDEPIASRTRRPKKVQNSSTPNISTERQPQSQGVVVTTEELAAILEKDDITRTQEDNDILVEWEFLIPTAKAFIRRKHAKLALAERIRELAEPDEAIEVKVDLLSKLVQESRYIVIYTGAGISTSASIPDYRGPNGLWTQRRKTGAYPMTRIHDLSRTEPTFTHMAISELVRRGLVKHVVSQNCDGLHLRSGVPQTHLSEIHGNMYIEVCPTCEKQYFRQADVTKKTSRFRHKTGRKCHSCKEPNDNLIDTIVLYGERSRTSWPMNWDRAKKSASSADLIICIGSSLMTLRRYSCLWPRGRSRANPNWSEPKLAIINLQHTPKDKQAVLKINGFCDPIMEALMAKLRIDVPDYNWLVDPLYVSSIPFKPLEKLNLNVNLIFEDRQRDSDSELTQVDNEEIANQSIDDKNSERCEADQDVLCDNDCINEDSSSSREPVDTTVTLIKSAASSNHTCSLPRWLSHNLGPSTNRRYYRRKRHGNKGRTRISTAKATNDN